MATATVKQNACLIVIDGWGIAPDSAGNAVTKSKAQWMPQFTREHQVVPLQASGLFVGLPEGLMGNSEVGHMNIGAGRVVYQDIVRIDLAVKDRSFHKNPVLLDAFSKAKAGNGRVHFAGLVSDGGVHSHINHLYALLEAAKEYGVPRAFVHFFGDGRDTSPTSAVGYMEALQAFIARLGYGEVATVTGRYYAMDRDKRWERVKVAWEALIGGSGERAVDAVAAIKARYAAGETDEFLKPIVLNPEGCIRDGDALILFDFRSDRMREICEAFLQPPFETAATVKGLHIATMTTYKKEFPFPVLFPPQSLDNVLAEWLAHLGVRQYHVAETEKYAHVTFFFNGGREAAFALEDRKMVPSPKVATYDLKPEMSAADVATEVVRALDARDYPFVMCNFAPPDMVGHTGKFNEAVAGVEATDAAIGAIYEACERNGYVLFVTADHGNAEKMLDDAGGPHTAHTTNPVPFVMTSRSHKFANATADSALCDVAPTILRVMGLPQPPDMSGKSLVP